MQGGTGLPSMLPFSNAVFIAAAKSNAYSCSNLWRVSSKQTLPPMPLPSNVYTLFITPAKTHAHLHSHLWR